MTVQTGPMLERVEEVVLGLTRLLDSRVYVALGRGLWDFTAKDVYDYVESLQEDRHNKVRNNALSVSSVFRMTRRQSPCVMGPSPQCQGEAVCREVSLLGILAASWRTMSP